MFNYTTHTATYYTTTLLFSSTPLTHFRNFSLRLFACSELSSGGKTMKNVLVVGAGAMGTLMAARLAVARSPAYTPWILSRCIS